MDFPFLDIFFFAMLAIFLGLRLRNVLGKRTGLEKRRPDPFKPAEPAPQPADNVLRLPDRDRKALENLAAEEDTPLARGIKAIHQADPSFDEAGFLAKASVFDPKKLEWMNGQHLASMDRAALTTLVVPKLIASGRVTDASLALRADRLEAALRLVQDQRRARTVDEVVAQALLFVADGMTYDDAALAKAWKDPADACAVLVAARDTLAACPTWDRETYEGALTRLGEARALPPARLLGPIRAALTGQANSPSIHDMLGIFGRDESLARIDAALAHPRLAGAA